MVMFHGHHALSASVGFQFKRPGSILASSGRQLLASAEAIQQFDPVSPFVGEQVQMAGEGI
jgi:hypothetical protein